MQLSASFIAISHNTLNQCPTEPNKKHFTHPSPVLYLEVKTWKIICYIKNMYTHKFKELNHKQRLTARLTEITQPPGKTVLSLSQRNWYLSVDSSVTQTSASSERTIFLNQVCTRDFKTPKPSRILSYSHSNLVLESTHKYPTHQMVFCLNICVLWISLTISQNSSAWLFFELPSLDSWINFHQTFSHSPSLLSPFSP